MRHATIVCGKYDDAWDKNAADHVVNDDGSINWRAAFFADPGVKSCPRCKTYFWNEAAVMECPDCHVQFGDGPVGIDLSPPV